MLRLIVINSRIQNTLMKRYKTLRQKKKKKEKNQKRTNYPKE